MTKRDFTTKTSDGSTVNNEGFVPAENPAEVWVTPEYPTPVVLAPARPEKLFEEWKKWWADLKTKCTRTPDYLAIESGVEREIDMLAALSYHKLPERVKADYEQAALNL